MNRIHSNIGLALAAALMIAGCASKPPAFQQGPDAEIAYDGLVRVDNTSFKRVWADPDADLSGYTKILPMKAAIEFRAVKGSRRSSMRLSSVDEFPIDDQNREKLVAEIGKVLREEISSNTRFAITDKPAQDTLILAVSLLDIVSRVPPEPIGRSDIYLSRVGEITLVIELKDSRSGETLLRAAERGAAEPTGSMGMRSSSVTTWAEVRRLAHRWGIKIRNGLESL